LPQPAHGNLIVGKVGKDLSIDEGYEAAKVCGLNIISTLKNHLGSLDKVKRVVKLNGFVNCPDDFTQQPRVINGCSDLMVAVFTKEIGTHARAAVGTNALPLGVAVEVEAIIEVH
jgi:enamine deaminase RidA (YjgF/YER057c/UK114 family)